MHGLVRESQVLVGLEQMRQAVRVHHNKAVEQVVRHLSNGTREQVMDVLDWVVCVLVQVLLHLRKLQTVDP